MLKLLQEAKYPDLRLGTYTHIAHSIHVYERHFNLVKEMLDCKFLELGFPKLKENLVDKWSKPHPIVLDLCKEIMTGAPLPYSKDDRVLEWIHSALNGTFEDRIYNKETNTSKCN